MSTLHHTQWHGLNHFQSHAILLNPGDALVLLGHWPSDALKQVETLLIDQAISTHLVEGSENPHIGSSIAPINQTQWLALITQHHNTHAWK